MIQASTSGFYVFVSHSNSPDELLRPDEAEKLIGELTTAVAEVRRAVGEHADQGHVAESVTARSSEAAEKPEKAPAKKPAAKAAARKPRKLRAKTTR